LDGELRARDSLTAIDGHRLGARHSLFRYVTGGILFLRFVDSFSGIQIPILVLSAVVITFKVNIKLPETKQTTRQKLARIDYAGSFTLVVCVGSLLLGLSLKTGEDLEWNSPTVVGLLCLSAVFAIAFVSVEAKWAPEPVMPMRLLTMRTPFFVALSNL
jgi:hypothetical protein